MLTSRISLSCNSHDRHRGVVTAAALLATSVATLALVIITTARCLGVHQQHGKRVRSGNTLQVLQPGNIPQNQLQLQ